MSVACRLAAMKGNAGDLQDSSLQGADAQSGVICICIRPIGDIRLARMTARKPTFAPRWWSVARQLAAAPDGGETGAATA